MGGLCDQDFLKLCADDDPVHESGPERGKRQPPLTPVDGTSIETVRVGSDAEVGHHGQRPRLIADSESPASSGL